MKIILDTNVVMSGLLFPNGPPGRIMDLWVENKLKIVVCQALIDEYFEVLLRPKFKRLGTIIDRQNLLMELLEMENSVFVFPKTRIDIIKDDPEDNRVLECAAEGEVQYIISGDDHLQALKEYKGIAIVSPAAFLNLV